MDQEVKCVLAFLACRSLSSIHQECEVVESLYTAGNNEIIVTVLVAVQTKMPFMYDNAEVKCN